MILIIIETHIKNHLRIHIEILIKEHKKDSKENIISTKIESLILVTFENKKEITIEIEVVIKKEIDDHTMTMGIKEIKGLKKKEHTLDINLL